MYKENGFYAIVAIIVVLVLAGILYLMSTPSSHKGMYSHSGECPVCHEELVKYCYGGYTPQFVWSCPNGCED